MSRNKILRTMFARYLGDAEYHRFLRAGTTTRLRFWQERVIANFTNSYPDLKVTIDELVVALRICEVHGDELIEESVQGVATKIDHIETHEMRATFPHANTGPIARGIGAEEKAVSVWYCPSCRKAREIFVLGPGADHLRINFSGLWSSGGIDNLSIKSAEVTKALKKEFFPVLKSAGFSLIRGRSAYKFLENTVSTVTVAAVGHYFGTITKFPPSSFYCHLGIHYRARGAAEGTHNDKDGIPQPLSLHDSLELEYFDQSRHIREQSMGKGEIERRDIWWIARDGSNTIEMVNDLKQAFLQKGPAWFKERENP